MTEASSNAAALSRIRITQRPETPSNLATWIQAAATVFEEQLRAEHCVPHSHIASILAEWLSMQKHECSAIAEALDSLQVAFDLSDNLADEEEDNSNGRLRCIGYAPIPNAARLCLPAYLISHAYTVISQAFEHRPTATVSTLRKMHEVLGHMITGQSHDNHPAKATLVSGMQGRLLCLPLWLSSDQALAMTDATEFWAEKWGTSWELRFAYHDKPTEDRKREWMRSADEARAAWPSFGPFCPGGPLAIEQQMSAIC